MGSDFPAAFYDKLLSPPDDPLDEEIPMFEEEEPYPSVDELFDRDDWDDPPDPPEDEIPSGGEFEGDFEIGGSE
jgi:hypothetical protein